MKQIKFRTQLFCAFLLILVGCSLLIAGIAIFPIGEIHQSVLIAFGECCTFSGALFGVDYHYKHLHVKNKKEEKEIDK